MTVDLVLAERREAAAGRRTTTVVAPSRPTARRQNVCSHATRRSLARVADPRQRRQRAYALLARNGFDPEICRTVAATVDGARELTDDD